MHCVCACACSCLLVESVVLSRLHVPVLQVFFEGGYSEYDADLRKRTGGDPTRIKYRKMAVLA